jgi:hypothetical protein
MRCGESAPAADEPNRGRAQLERPQVRPAHDVAVSLDRDRDAVERSQLDALRVDALGVRPDAGGPAAGLDQQPWRRAGVDAQRQPAGIDSRPRVDLQAAAVERRGADHHQLDRAAMHGPVVGLDPHPRALPQVRDRSGDRAGPAAQAARARIGIALCDQGVPAGAGEQCQAPIDRDQVDRPSLTAADHPDEVVGVAREIEQVRRRVAEARRDVAEHELRPPNGDVVRHAQ